MKEIYRMWRMVRLLKKDRFVWAVQLLRMGATQKEYEVNGEMVSGRKVDDVIIQSTVSHEVMHYNKEARAKRLALCNVYVLKYYPRLNIGRKEGAIGFDLMNEDFQETLLEAQSIVNSCVSHNPQFIKTEGDDKLVYLTTEGKKFAGFDGLIKTLVEDLGPFKAIVLTAFTTLIVVYWKPVLNFILVKIGLSTTP